MAARTARAFVLGCGEGWGPAVCDPRLMASVLPSADPSPPILHFVSIEADVHFTSDPWSAQGSTRTRLRKRFCENAPHTFPAALDARHCSVAARGTALLAPSLSSLFERNESSVRRAPALPLPPLHPAVPAARPSEPPSILCLRAGPSPQASSTLSSDDLQATFPNTWDHTVSCSERAGAFPRQLSKERQRWHGIPSPHKLPRPLLAPSHAARGDGEPCSTCASPCCFLGAAAPISPAGGSEGHGSFLP